MVAKLPLKNAWLPTFFFLDSNNPCYDLLFPHSYNLCKNTSVLGRTVLKRCNKAAIACSNVSLCTLLHRYCRALRKVIDLTQRQRSHLPVSVQLEYSVTRAVGQDHRKVTVSIFAVLLSKPRLSILWLASQ